METVKQYLQLSDYGRKGDAVCEDLEEGEEEEQEDLLEVGLESELQGSRDNRQGSGVVTQAKIQEKINKLEELKRKQEELDVEINKIKTEIGNVLIDEDVTIKNSFVSKRLIKGLKGNYTYKENVHIMVLPVAETIEKQLMVLLRERQTDLTDFLNILQNNIDMMQNTMGLVENFVNFGAEQVGVGLKCFAVERSLFA